MMKLALKGKSRFDILNYLYYNVKSPKIKEVIEYAKKHATKSVLPEVSGKSKGWVLSSFYCALVALMYFYSFEQAMKYIISIPDSDTDTNAAIAGALLGCIMGFDGLSKEYITKDNIDKIIDSNSDRPGMYKLNDFYSLTEALSRLK